MVRRRDSFIRKGKYSQAKDWANRTPALYRSFTILASHILVHYGLFWSMICLLYMAQVRNGFQSFSTNWLPLDVNLALTLSSFYSAATIKLSCLKITESICESKKWGEHLCGESVLAHWVLRRQKWGWVVNAWVSHTHLWWAYPLMHELPILSLYYFSLLLGMFFSHGIP